MRTANVQPRSLHANVTGLIDAFVSSRVVRAVNTCGAVDSAVVTYTVPLAKPAASPPHGAALPPLSFRGRPRRPRTTISSSAAPAGSPYAVIATVTASPFTDTLSIAANTTYVYRLRAFDASGGSASPYSDPDLATTKIFSAIIAGNNHQLCRSE